MKEMEAEKILSLIISAQHKFDDILVEVGKIDNEKEKEAITKSVKSVIGDVIAEIILPIVHQHPDLNPYIQKDK